MQKSICTSGCRSKEFSSRQCCHRNDGRHRRVSVPNHFSLRKAAQTLYYVLQRNQSFTEPRSAALVSISLELSMKSRKIWMTLLQNSACSSGTSGQWSCATNIPEKSRTRQQRIQRKIPRPVTVRTQIPTMPSKLH